MPLKEAVACIKRNKRFLITSHVNPEADALGAQIAFYRFLKMLGKSAVMVNQDISPYGCGFLPGINKIIKFRDNLKRIKFDCLVILDCSDLARTGVVSGLNKENKPVMNIDHHISNDNFADINWVDIRASSCAEMVYRLYKEFRLPLDRQIATLLYAGIMTDTGSFRHSNTTATTHRIVSELLSYGLDTVDIHRNLYGNIPFADMKLLSRILPGMRRAAAGKIVWFQIKKGLLRNRRISIDLSEHILSFARAIKGVEVAVLFKENFGAAGEIRVNLRSQGKVDVNKIAAFFGGGGHKAASGCTISGKIDSVRRKVLAKVRQALR